MYKLLKSSVLTALLLFVLCIPAGAATVKEVQQAIIKESVAMGVEPAIMLSIAKTESGFRQEARGGHNVGVFQLHPATARRMGYDVFKLEENIKAGIAYYKAMYNMFGSMELAVAAYNVGPGMLKRCNNTVPNSARPFVARIMKDYQYYKTN